MTVHETEADKLVKELDNISMELSGRAASVLSKAISLIQSQADKIERLEGVRDKPSNDALVASLEADLVEFAYAHNWDEDARSLMKASDIRGAISRLTQEQS